MKRFIAKMACLSMIGNLVVCNGSQTGFAQDGANQVSLVTVEEKGKVGITLTRDAREVTFTTFTIEKAPRIVIDVSDSELTVDEKTVPGPEGSIIKQVRSAQHSMQPDRVVRIVLDLEKLVDYTIEKSGSQLIVLLVENPGNPGEKKEAEDETSEYAEEVEDTEYVPEQEDEELPVPSVEESSDDIEGASKGEGRTSIVENLSTQLVTLDFNQADLTDVFRILSAKSGVNIIFGDDVEGELTIHLSQVPFNEAFKTILSLKSLVAQQVGKNILRIITPEALAIQRSKSVTFWRVFPLNYADVKDAKRQIDGIRSAEGRRGTIEIDLRTNSLIVADSPEGLDDVGRLIAEIDIKPAQVLIESRFVEVSLESRLDIGIEWGYHSYKESGNKATIIGTGEVERGVDTIVGTGRTNVTPSLGTGVSAPIPGSIGSFQFGLIDNEQALIARLTALASQGKAKFLSSPKITTLNNKEAVIWIGSQIPIRTTTWTPSATAISVVYKQVGIELRVTPTINVDDRITLKVRPEVSLPDTANITPDGDIPINTRYAETTVLIKNNETLVIGGFIEESKTEGISKVPLLGDIPVLGQFFRSNINRKSRRELLVFITPKILKD